MGGPGARLRFVGQAQALQALQAANQQQTLALQLRFVEASDLHATIVASFTLQRVIQARPPLLFHLPLQGLLDFQFGARPYQNDRNRWKATDTFLRNFARETFGPADAQKLETKADLAGAFMTWGKGKKPFKSLPLEDKLGQC